jgi:two-component system, cell cycle sensor histidine kinase PleC
MHRSATSITLVPAPTDGGVTARLALAELLLACGDLHAAARKCLEWLARHAGVARSLVAIAAPDGPRLLVVAAHGVKRESYLSHKAGAGLKIGYQDSTHPLALATNRREPTYFARASAVYPPLAGSGFHAIPLRAEGRGPAYGILLASSPSEKIAPNVSWVVEQLSRLVARLFMPPDKHVTSIVRNAADLAQPRADVEVSYRTLRLAHLERRVEDAAVELAAQGELLRRQHIEIEQASALRSQFLTNISHEFRTPLNAILGYTHMLLRGVAGAVTEPQRKSLQRIDANSRHLLTHINDILDITRLEAGQIPLKLTKVRISELVDEVLSEIEPLIQRSNLAVTVRMRGTLPAVRTDREKVKQIVLNLLSNALKFTPTGSVTISASVETRRRLITIVVRDTGVGIPEESQGKIFEDFRQLDNSPARGYGGTGLGLPICRRLAEMLGGSIDVESQVGEGSTFTLRLPVHARQR